MSWDNEENYRTGKTVRAVALCDRTDSQGFFYAAINCMRDGSMGEKGEDGVYSRIWWGDYIENGDVQNLRYATIEEVELYLKHCPLENEEKDLGEKIVCIIYDNERTVAIVQRKGRSLFQRIRDFFVKEKLPF
jgi:hypothetical protein